jgi:predicted ATP-grasp superfamily ATP-dependent carboligase
MEESDEDKIIEFDKEKCPENLVKRLNILIEYMDLVSKKIKNDKIIYPKSGENDDKKEISENSDIFYIRRYIEEKSTSILYLSNGSIQLNFMNSQKIILPPNGKDVIMFIDKYKTIWNIQNINIMNNSNKDFVKGIKIFREFEKN